eukprot:1930708-Prymnesium_polylepis.1
MPIVVPRRAEVCPAKRPSFAKPTPADWASLSERQSQMRTGISLPALEEQMGAAAAADSRLVDASGATRALTTTSLPMTINSAAEAAAAELAAAEALFGKPAG